jgi:hypothetical protein
MPKNKHKPYRDSYHYTDAQLMEDAVLTIELPEGAREMFRAAFPCGCPATGQACRHEEEALRAVLLNPDGWDAMAFILGLFTEVYPRIVSDDLLGRYMDQRDGTSPPSESAAA